MSTSVPPLQFGRNKASPIYGHRKYPASNKSAVLILILGFLVFIPSVNLAYLEEEYGITIPLYTRLLTQRGVGIKE